LPEGSPAAGEDFVSTSPRLTRLECADGRLFTASPSPRPRKDKVVIVMPAYNAAKTLETPFARFAALLRRGRVVDDHSGDETPSWRAVST